MKKGFKQLFVQERFHSRSQDEEETNLMEMESERKSTGFFQRFFRPIGSRPSLTNENSKQQRILTKYESSDEDIMNTDKTWPGQGRSNDIMEVREMSMPSLPTKSVTFKDEIMERRGQSVVPQSTYSPRMRTTYKFNYEGKDQKLESYSQEDNIQSRRTKENTIPVQKSREASHNTLDEATFDLLHLSSLPDATISYNSTSHIQPFADSIQKSSSTNSINKVIRTKQDGSIKLNEFSLDEYQRKSNCISDKSHIIEINHINRAEEAEEVKCRQGPPVIRTVVEGDLQTEKIVGAELTSFDQCVYGTWIVKDVVTNYKVKTYLGKRMLLLEDQAVNGKEQRDEFTMSLYEQGILKSEQDVRLQIPQSTDKMEYLTEISQRLLTDLASLNNDDPLSIPVTRVEVEVIENITKILKTYIIGEKACLAEAELDQAAIDASDEFTAEKYNYEERKLTDVLDIQLESYGKSYSGHDQLILRQKYESETSSDSVLPNLMQVAECGLRRTEDCSSNEVCVATSNSYAGQMSTVFENTNTMQQHAHSSYYDMEQQGKYFTDKTTLKKRTIYELEDESETKMDRNEISTFLNCDLKRYYDSSSNQVVIAVPLSMFIDAIIMNQKRMKTGTEISNYNIKQEGQHFEGETIFRRAKRVELSESSDEEINVQVNKIQELREFRKDTVSYEMSVQGQDFKGETLIKQGRDLISSDSDYANDEAQKIITYVDLNKANSRGEFEVILVLSNETSLSPVIFQESIQSETTNAIFFLRKHHSTALADRLVTIANKWTECFNGKELNEETINAMVAMRSVAENSQQNIMKNLSNRLQEKTSARFIETIEEQLMIMFCLQKEIKEKAEIIEEILRDRAILKINHFLNAAEDEQIFAKIFINSPNTSNNCEMIQTILKIANESRTMHSCQEMCSENASTVIYLQNRAATNEIMSTSYNHIDKRRSFGHKLSTKASLIEEFKHDLYLKKRPLYGNEYLLDYCVREAMMKRLELVTCPSIEVERTSYFALNKGAKSAATNTRLISKTKERNDANLKEYSDKSENIAIMMRNTGIMQEQATGEWCEPVTGRSRPSTNFITGFIDLSTNNINIYRHISNFKTLLPLHGTAMLSLPSPSQYSVSFVCSSVPRHFYEKPSSSIIFNENYHRSKDFIMHRKSNTDLSVCDDAIHNIAHTFYFNKPNIGFSTKVSINEINNAIKYSYLKESERYAREIKTIFDRSNDFIKMKKTDRFYKSGSKVHVMHTLQIDEEMHSDQRGLKEFTELKELDKSNVEIIKKDKVIEIPILTNQEIQYVHPTKPRIQQSLQQSCFDAYREDATQFYGEQETTSMHQQTDSPIISHTKNGDQKAIITEKTIEINGMSLDMKNNQQLYVENEGEQMKMKDYKRDWGIDISETRVAMLNAGFDLDTTLLSTPTGSFLWNQEENKVEEDTRKENREIYDTGCYSYYDSRNSSNYSRWHSNTMEFCHHYHGQTVIPNEFYRDTSKDLYESTATWLHAKTNSEFVENVANEFSHGIHDYAGISSVEAFSRESHHMIKRQKIIESSLLNLDLDDIHSRFVHEVEKTSANMDFTMQFPVPNRTIEKNLSNDQYQIATYYDDEITYDKNDLAGLNEVSTSVVQNIRQKVRNEEEELSSLGQYKIGFSENCEAMAYEASGAKASVSELNDIGIVSTVSSEQTAQDERASVFADKILRMWEQNAETYSETETEIESSVQANLELTLESLKSVKITEKTITAFPKMAEQLNLQGTIESETDKNAILESKIKEESAIALENEKKYAKINLSIKEFGNKDETYGAHWSKIERNAENEMSFQIANREMQNFSTVEAVNSNIGHAISLMKISPTCEIPIINKLVVKEAVLQKFSADIKRFEAKMEKDSIELFANLALADSKKEVVGASTTEFSDSFIETAACFSLIENTQPYQRVDRIMEEKRRVEQKLITSHASTKFIELSINLIAKRESVIAKDCLLKDITNDMIVAYLKAAHDVSTDGFVDLKKPNWIQDSEKIIRRDAAFVVNPMTIKQSSDEQRSYSYGWTALNRDLSAEKVYPDVHHASELLKTKTSIYEIIELAEEMKLDECLADTFKILALDHRDFIKRKWEINRTEVKEEMKKRFKSGDQFDFCEIFLAEKQNTKAITQIREYYSSDSECLGSFSQLTSAKRAAEKITKIIPIPYIWKEIFVTEASGEESAESETSFTKPYHADERNIIKKQANNDSMNFHTKASSHYTALLHMELSSLQNEDKIEIIVNDVPREELMSHPIKEYEAKLHSTDASWITIDNELETEKEIPINLLERAIIKTKASEELSLDVNSLITCDNEQYSIEREIPLVSLAIHDKCFHIASEYHENLLLREDSVAEQLEIILKDKVQDNQINRTLLEITESSVDAGILLMQRSAQKLQMSASHTINQPITIFQSFQTLSATMFNEEISAEFTVTRPSCNIEDKKSVNMAESATLKTEYAKEIKADSNFELATTTDRNDIVENIQRIGNKIRASQEMKEFNSSAFEILSNWTIVYRDLEAEVRFLEATKDRQLFATDSAAFEEIALHEVWQSRTINLFTEKIFAIKMNENCIRWLSITADSLKISIEKYEQREKIFKILADKLINKISNKFKECGDEKLNAIVNLHKITYTSPHIHAIPSIWPTYRTVSVEPLRLQYDSMENDFTNIEISLQKKELDATTECLKIAANRYEPCEFSSEQCSEEKIKLIVNIEGKDISNEIVETKWPEVNKAEPTGREVKEFGDDDTSLIIQFTSSNSVFAETLLIFNIARECQPLILNTFRTLETNLDILSELGIPSQTEYLFTVIIAANKGENLLMQIFEPINRYLTIGYQFSKDYQTLNTIYKIREARFGGDYHLSASFVKEEYRNIDLLFSKSNQNEMTKHRLKQQIILSLPIFHQMAYKSAEISMEFNSNKSSDHSSFEITRFCPRSTQPVLHKLREMNHVLYTVYASFKRYDQYDRIIKTVEVANYGESVSLCTECAEEIDTSVSFNYINNEIFSSVKITILAPITNVLNHRTKACTEESVSLCRELIEYGPREDICRSFVGKIRGEGIEKKMKESKDIKQISYLEYSKKLSFNEIERIIDEIRFGGHIKLKTDACEYHELNVIRELTSNRLFIKHCSQVIKENLRNKPMILSAKASEINACTLTTDLHSSLCDSKQISKICIEKIYEKYASSIKESVENDVIVNIFCHKDSENLFSEIIFKISRQGGNYSFGTLATKNEQESSAYHLNKSRITVLGANQSIIIKNKEVPVYLQSAYSKEESVSIMQEQKSPANYCESCTLVKRSSNEQKLEFSVNETTDVKEIVYSQYAALEASKLIERIFCEPNFGGSLVLNTVCSSDLSTDSNISLQSEKPSTAAAYLIIKVIPVEKIQLNCTSSMLNEITTTISFKRGSDLQAVGTIWKSSITAYLSYVTTETSFFDECLNISWHKVEQSAALSDTIEEKRFGGCILFATNYAHQEETTIPCALIAAARELKQCEFVIAIANLTINPTLSTKYAIESILTYSSSLSKASALQQTLLEVETANKGESVKIDIQEATLINETTNLQYEKHAQCTTKTHNIDIPRLGGFIYLSTLASQDIHEKIYLSLVSSVIRQVAAAVVLVCANKGEQSTYRCMAASEEGTSMNASLQKTAGFYNYSTKLRSSLKGESSTFHTKESLFLEEFNTVHMKQNELTEDVSRILNEKRFGGIVTINTMSAKDICLTIIQEFIRKCDFGEVFKTKKVRNEIEPAKMYCKASSENTVSAMYHFENTKLKILQKEIILRDSTRTLVPILNTAESIELYIAINISMMKSVEQENCEKILKEVRYGGISRLECSAISEEIIELSSIALERKSTALSVNFTKVITNDSKQDKSIKGSTEESFMMDANMISPSEIRTISASTILYIPRTEEGLMHRTRASSQTIFNFNISFQKQDAQANFSWTMHEARCEAPEHLHTQASSLAETDLIEFNVERQMNGLLVETIVARAARELTPIILKTDQAAETFVRIDEIIANSLEWHVGEVGIKRSMINREREEILCAAPVHVTLRHEDEYRAETKEEKSDKRVSFAAEVMERTMTMDMSMTVERREAPSIVKKPMKKENRSKRGVIKMNEAPTFIPIRRNSLLLAMDLSSPHNIPHYKTLQDVIKGIKKAGLEYSNLIFGIDYTRSNFYQGEKTFDGRNLHSLDSEEMNPYQQVIDIVGKTLSSFDADGVIPTYGFGDEETLDQGIFNLYNRNDMDAECNGFEEVLKIYNEKTPFIKMSGPTNFVPLIEKAVDIVREKQSYHILVIVADGQVTNEKINQKAIAAASHYPLSIIMVGVGDGPWSMMTRFDETLPKRIFDNFHFVDYHKVMFNAPNQEASFALNALMEIPDQYKAIKDLGLLKHTKRG